MEGLEGSAWRVSRAVHGGSRGQFAVVERGVALALV